MAPVENEFGTSDLQVINSRGDEAGDHISNLENKEAKNKKEESKK